MTTVTVRPQILTYTGRVVNPLDVRPEDVCIEDVAHSLACSNRFCGHTVAPWNTAQHSIGVMRVVQAQSSLYDREKLLKSLLHDGGEAYVGDMTKWLKHSPEMASYREAEDRAQRAVYEAFRLDPGDDPDIEAGDRFMVRLEATDGFQGRWIIDHHLYGPMTEDERLMLGPWRPWDWRLAEKEFLKAFKELS
jgi:hypothetical protein